jgi:predicted DNA binding CopG/RHH family protein
MKPMPFELRRKDKTVSLRLPGPLLDAVRQRAERAGMPYQRFIRMAVERALHEVNWGASRLAETSGCGN